MVDIKHFYLNKILPYPEFMRIPFKIIPQEIIDTYDLKALVDDQGWIYMHTKNGMYGLKQDGIIENQELVKHMAPFRYNTVNHTTRLCVRNSKKKSSVWWLMISVSNIALQRMQTIFKTPSEPNTSSQSIWKRQYTLGLN